MTSLNKKNISTQLPVWKSVIQRPVSGLFYMGLLVIIMAALIPIFQNISWANLIFGLLMLGFAYWGYQHGQVDTDKPTQGAAQLWQVFIALLGLITLFGIYLTLALVFKYDFQTVFEYILSRFLLLVIAYTLGYYRSHFVSTAMTD
jgi:hypothetical protein